MPLCDISKTIGHCFINLIHLVGPKKCMLDITVIYQELLIMSVWIYKLKTLWIIKRDHWENIKRALKRTLGRR